MNALAPRSCFVGVINWQVVQSLKDFLDRHPQATEVLQWILLILCLVYLYVTVVVKLWNLFLSKRGPEWDRRDEEERKIEDEEQIQQVEEYLKRKREKKERKKDRRRKKDKG